MIEYLKFEPWHLDNLVPQPELISEFLVVKQNADLVAGTTAFSGFVGPICIGCAGFAVTWGGRAVGWALLSVHSGPYMRDATRFARKVMSHYEQAGVATRYETTVKAGFVNGFRWLNLLGFADETPNGMRNYGPNGETYHLFARVASNVRT